MSLNKWFSDTKWFVLPLGRIIEWILIVLPPNVSIAKWESKKALTLNMVELNVSSITIFAYYYVICLVFIRSAQTINKLEVRRTEVINHLVIFLQKHWRGTLQRIRYKKMIASLKIMAFYRKYKLRAYMKDLDVRFRNVRQMEDRGKSISWGSPPKSIIATVDYFKLVFRRWQAHFVLISYPKEIHPDIKLRLDLLKCFQWF